MLQVVDVVGGVGTVAVPDALFGLRLDAERWGPGSDAIARKCRFAFAVVAAERWGTGSLRLPLCRILIAFSRDLIAFCRRFDSAQGRFDGFLIARPFMMLPVAREESYAYR